MSTTPTNDNAPINDASTLVARLEEHSDFAHKVVRDLLREASGLIIRGVERGQPAMHRGTQQR